MKKLLLLIPCVLCVLPFTGKSQSAASLQSQITALRAQIQALQNLNTQEVTQGRQTLTSQQNQIDALRQNPAIQFGCFLQIDPNPQNGVAGPNVTIKGINLHIVSGSGQTQDLTGLGNLIIGYDEAGPGLLFPGARNGSHNLVIGRNNLFRAFGGIVQGEGNAIFGFESAALGGSGNIAFGNFSSVFGGASNQALNSIGTVVGGSLNTANGILETLVGGFQNSLTLNYGATLGSSAGAPQ